MLSPILMITSLTRPTNFPYPSSSSTKRSLHSYQMLTVYKPCITVQFKCSVSMTVTVTVTTISSWNKLFMTALKLIRHTNFRAQLSCWQPDYRKLTRSLAAIFENFSITKTQKVVTQV
jgi:hypothetical protein